MSDRDTLLSMGFDASRVDWALRSTGSAGLQQALDHLEANQDKPVPDPASQSAPSSKGAAAVEDDYDAEDQAALADMLGKKGQAAQDQMMAGAAEAKSIKCLDCGKMLKSADFASYHAEKSGHTNFEESTEEIKPLTEEEKKARLDEMRAKLAAKKAAQAKVDAEEARANEKIRRKAGQDLGLAKEELKKKEAAKEAEKRRKEAVADAEAKKRVREQIEADKRERAAKAAREKALRDGTLPAAEAGPVSVPKPTSSGVSATASNANEARLRVRAPGGMWMGSGLPAETTLRQVEGMIRDEGKASGPLQFSTTFPRKVFSEAEKDKDLRQLGLVPNAALEASALP